MPQYRLYNFLGGYYEEKTMLHIDIVLMGAPASAAALGKLSTLFQGLEPESSAPWWLFWLLAILFIVSMGIWWLLQSGQEPAQSEETAPTPVVATDTVEAQAASPGEVEPAPTAEIEADAAEPASTADLGPSQPEPAAAPAPPVGDDLKRIEGIGPKISGLLKDAGITTFIQLADTEVSRLEQILEAADLRLANPETWPEQAKLAAAGDWDTLAQLQEDLKGGRRI
jgi:predicted flap endonuclease-1-like 5' DNA nuclease